MNAWGYIALVSIGIITGMILHWYLVRDRIQNRKIEIRKNKQKNGEGNVQELDIEMQNTRPPVDKTSREERRDARKEKRQMKKTEIQLKQTLNNQKLKS